MSDPSEIIPSASVGMEHVGSRKKGSCKFREPSQLRSELGDVETRLVIEHILVHFIIMFLMFIYIFSA